MKRTGRSPCWGMCSSAACRERVTLVSVSRSPWQGPRRIPPKGDPPVASMPMRRINIRNPEFRYDDDDPDGFRAGMFRFGPQLGASQLGTTVYELPPGQTICPYHYEY